MEIEWSRKAIIELDKIYTSVLTLAQSEDIAYGLYLTIVRGADVLETFPFAGPLEPLLNELPLALHSLVVHHHYKLIYYIDDACVHIVDVWDCRMNPESLIYQTRK